MWFIAWNLPSAIYHEKDKIKKEDSFSLTWSRILIQVEMLHSKITSGIVSSFKVKPIILDWADVLTTDSKAVQSEYKKKLGKDFLNIFLHH